MRFASETFSRSSLRIRLHLSNHISLPYIFLDEFFVSFDFDLALVLQLYHIDTPLVILFIPISQYY